jgi:two-component system NtrC family sensor kinase
MKQLVRYAEKSIIAKLTIATGILILGGSFLFWYAILHKQNKDVIEIAVSYGESFIDYVKKRTLNNAHSFRMQDIQQTLEDISIAEGVDRVRIFSHTGQISFSTSSEEIGQPVDKTGLACAGCHPSPGNMSDILTEPVTLDIFRSPGGYTALKLIEPLHNEASCSSLRCHKGAEGDKILGFVEADISLAILDEARLKQGLALMLYTLIFLIAVSLSSVLILWKIVTRPARELSQSIGIASSGNLDHSVPVHSRDEMGMLALSFNAMTKELKSAREKIDTWAHKLEAEVARKTNVIREAHAGMVQTEKLASLGRMASGIAKELDDPLKKIESTARQVQKRFPPHSPDSEELRLIIEQTERSEKIIQNFLHFSAARPAERERVDIPEILERTIFILKNQKKFRNITINLKTEDGPFTGHGEVSQFQQVFLNMLVNAADAVNERGTISVAIRKTVEDNISFVEVEFTDTGPGIREEDLPRLFEPFFSTKQEEKGSGLGLSVCHGIVSHLGGNIQVSSEEGRGTSFFVRFPYVE